MLTKQEASELIGSEIAAKLNAGVDPTGPGVHDGEGSIEPLARFLFAHDPDWQGTGRPWEQIPADDQAMVRDFARNVLRDSDKLKSILAEILQRGGRF